MGHGKSSADAQMLLLPDRWNEMGETRSQRSEQDGTTQEYHGKQKKTLLGWSHENNHILRIVVSKSSNMT